MASPRSATPKASKAGTGAAVCVAASRELRENAVAGVSAAAAVRMARRPNSAPVKAPTMIRRGGGACGTVKPAVALTAAPAKKSFSKRSGERSAGRISIREGGVRGDGASVDAVDELPPVKKNMDADLRADDLVGSDRAFDGKKDGKSGAGGGERGGVIEHGDRDMSDGCDDADAESAYVTAMEKIWAEAEAWVDAEAQVLYGTVQCCTVISIYCALLSLSTVLYSIIRG